jgi:aryl-alcohol dehydrogenase-like predicted oxidoreductase
VRFRRLGGSGTLVTEFCLGTMTFGTETDEPEAHRILDEFVEAGGNFIDTADPYSDGVSEEIIGSWLARRGRSDDLVIATKVFFPMGDNPNEQGLSARWIKREINSSLRRLQLDHVDLYQAHCWDPLTPLEETLAAFDDLVHAGKARYVGVSNFMGWQLQRAALLTRIHGWARIVTLQPQYNLLAREIEWELVPVCLAEGIGLLPWSPLGGGWLTGKYRPDERPTGATRLGENPERGVEAYDKRNVERTWRILGEVERIVRERGSGATHSQVALNWLRRRPAMTSVILGVRNLTQLRDNISALEWKLSDEEAQALDEVSDPGSPYPKAFIDDAAERRQAALDSSGATGERGKV